MSFFSGSISGHRRRIKYHENTIDHELDTAMSPGSIDFAHGDWVMPSGATNNQANEGNNWFSISQWESSPHAVHELYSYSYNTTDHTISAINNFSLQTNGNGGGGIVQLSGDAGIYGRRWVGSGVNSAGSVITLNSTLTGLVDVTFADIGLWYCGGARWNNTQGMAYSTSGNSLGAIAATHNFNVPLTADNWPENDGITTGGNNSGGAWGASTTFMDTIQWFHSHGGYALSSPGGTGTRTYGNSGTLNILCWPLLDGTDNASAAAYNNLTSGTEQIGHMYWNGGEDHSITLFSDEWDFTKTSGASWKPQILSTTWGNVILFCDNLDDSSSQNSVRPITWLNADSDDPTVTTGSAVVWDGSSAIPMHELNFESLSTVGAHNAYSCGQKRENNNIYRTCRQYEKDGSTYIDFVIMDFSNSNGTHKVYRTHREAYSFSKTGIEILSQVFMKNDKDVLILFGNVNDNNVGEAKLVYFEDAFYDF